MSRDWLLRQYEDTARALACFVLGREYSVHEELIFADSESLSRGDLLLFELRGMLREGRVNEAENRLFELVEADTKPEYLPAALDFYERLAALNDAQLAACRFSREEVAEGLGHLRALYEDGAVGKAVP